MHSHHPAPWHSTQIATIARRSKWLAFPLTVMLAAAVAGQNAAVAAPAKWEPPKAQNVAGIVVRDVKPATKTSLPQAKPVDPRPAVTWPSAGSAQVDLSTTAPPKTAALAARAATTDVRAGSLPVRIGRAPQDAKINGKALAAADAPTRVAVTVHDKAAADRAGVSGVLLSISRADQSTRSGAVSTTLDYSGFAKAYGGDWASRLRLVQLPACALSRPDDSACTKGTTLATTNDTAAQTLTATAPLTTANTLLATESGASGDNGDYSATDLKSAGTWNVSNQTGDFSWSLPVRVPDASGAVTPSINLGYSSGNIDGLTGATNTQGGWVGDGWSMWPGFIERKYNSCTDDDSQHKTGDLCWFNQNATLSLNGHAGQLIQDGSIWRLKDDDGTKVERVTDPTRENGDNDNEYWKVTTTDGVQYYFGYHKLPGWLINKPLTDSVWTAPVYGNDKTDPCYNTDFDKANCDQAWRWNLDYVVDPHGNSMAYFYGKETGAYGRNADIDKRTTYVRGGYLKRIEYGMRKNAENGEAAPLRVVFDTAERCKSGCWSGVAWESKANKSAWPDTPWDQYCETDAKCTEQSSPTFWSTRRLTKITTQERTGTTSYADIESWALRQDFVGSTTGESTPMWLSGITHTGLLKNIAGDPAVHDPITVPEIQFITGSDPLDNRVDAAGDHRSALSRYRIKEIKTESGGDLLVTYSPASDCTRDHLPGPDTNTTRCMPAYYGFPGTGEPILDWFHKYVVTRVDENDLVTDQPSTTTFYDYLDKPAWHYQDDEITKDKFKTWGDWRGYGSVRVRKGTEASGQTAVEYRYMRGMDRDLLTGDAKRSVSVSDWGGTLVDHEALNGFLRQEITYNGGTATSVGSEINTTVNDPWVRGPTAIRARNGVITYAYMVHTAKSRTRTKLASGGYRYRTTTSAFNDDGLARSVDDTGDENVSGDESCIRNTYAPNTDTWILGKVTFTEKLSIGCSGAPGSAAPSTVVSRTRNFYDKYDDESSFNAAPTIGNLVRVEQLDSWSGTTPRYTRTQSSTYDSVGRVTSVTDARGYTSSTEYVTTNGGLVTQTVAKNALQQKVTTTQEPAWGIPTTTTDANSILTTLRYDALGRLAAVWRPGRSTANVADIKYSYFIRQSGGPTAVVTETLLPTGTTYKKSVTLYDGFLRQRQQQSQAAGGGRLLMDTFHNTRGDVDWTSKPYYDVTNAAVTTDLGRPQGQIPALTQSVYDGGGRETQQIFSGVGGITWKSTTSYGGDRTSVTPPNGGTATTTITDIFGRATALRQYKNPADVGKDDPALFDETTYNYDAAGNLSTMTDSTKKNTWSYTYDLRGRPVKNTNPDSGDTSTTYDAAGNVETITNNLHQVLAYTYDELGRPTSLRSGSVSGAKRAEWTYDTVTRGVGKPARSIRWVGTTAYETRVDGYDTAGRPTGSSLVLPSTAGALCAGETAAPCTYSTATTYKVNGATATTTMPKAAGLAKETLTRGYDDMGEETTLLSPTQIYVQTAIYDKLGNLNGIDLGNTGSRVAVRTSYDEPTRRVTATNVVPELKAEAVNYGYTYNDAGYITKITDTTQGQTADVQCFDHDYLGRLILARTSAVNDCKAATPSPTALGSSAPYWRAWEYDSTGNRIKETQYAAAGNTVIDYRYPAAGTVRPHAVTQVTTTSPSQSTSRGFAYDADGNMTTRTSNAGTAQTLNWDTEGHLDNVMESSKTTSYIYDADGNRLIRKSPTGTTLYLQDGTEVTVGTGSTTATAVRYYQHAGDVIAERTAAALTWIISDHQGTAQLTIAASGLAVTKRRTLPFGEQRASTGIWPTAIDKGFTGGTNDPTGLTHLGAREYDPAIGRFISVDPLINSSAPASWNSYSYANNSPVTASDANGLSCRMDDGSQCAPAQRTSTPTTTTPTGTGSGSGTGSSSGSSSDSNSDPVGTATIDYTPNNAYVCVKGYACLDSRQVTNLSGYANAYNAELARLRARNNGTPLQDFQYAQAMVVGCGMGKDSNCASWAYHDLDWISSGKSVAAQEAAHGKNNVGEVESAIASGLVAVAGLPACALRGVGLGRKSFSGDTLVLMSDRTKKKIKDIQPGDEVKTVDPLDDDEPSGHKVSHVWVHGDDLYPLSVNGGVVITTEDHPFWDETDRKWEKAADLDPGDHLRTANGTTAKVEKFSYSKRRYADAFNLTVEDLHTYFVMVGQTPVLVHNGCSEERVVQQTLGPQKKASGISAERGDKVLDHEQEFINMSGDMNGCSTCDARVSGYKDGHWTGDHQPPYKLAPNGPWTLYPQCKVCVIQQGGIVTGLNKGGYRF